MILLFIKKILLEKQNQTIVIRILPLLHGHIEIFLFHILHHHYSCLDEYYQIRQKYLYRRIELTVV